MSTLTPRFRSLALCLACASLGCGGDDTMEPPPQCTVDVALTGGYEVSATGTSCNGGSQQGPDAFTVIIDVPDGKSNSVQLRLFGVQLGGGAKGMTVPAGVLFSVAATEVWLAGMDDGSACTAVVDDDFAEPNDSPLRILQAHVQSCSKQLISQQAGNDPITVVRVRGAARY